MMHKMNAMRRKTAVPWLWLLLAVGVTSLPYLIVYATTPPGQIFTATLINPDDTSVYLSAMRQGMEGKWLFHFQFSPETITPKVMYMPYMLAGHLAAWLGGSLVTWFHLWRVVAGVVTLLVLWGWLAFVFPGQRRWQLSAWLLIVFGSGFGWLVAIVTGKPLHLIPDLGISEWGVVMPLLDTPHFALAPGLLTAVFWCVAKACKPGNGRYWVLAALAGFLLGWVYPYLVPVAAVVTAVYILVRTGQQRRINWLEWGGALLFAAGLLPFVFYYGVWTRRDANWASTHVTNNIIPSPTPWALLLAFGLVGLLALFGAVLWLRQKREPFVLVWAGVQCLLLYFPVPYAGRFLMGLIVPVGTLAGYGLEAGLLPWLAGRLNTPFWQKISTEPLATVRRVLLILTVPSTLMVVLFLCQVAFVRADYPLFLPQADETAVQWLAAHTTVEDVVFAAYPVGNYLPRVSPARVFVGQPFITVEMDKKLALQAQFWQPETTEAWRQAFLAEWGITYVYVGSYERPLLPQNSTPPGELVYANDGVEIYAIPQQ
jgi:hypothetical protein